jgi:hypothetical protein
MSLMTLFDVALLALSCGLVLLVVGWRGRRVADHPVCRRCRFDLFGTPADSTACPECGADLAGRRAVLPPGTRVRRPRLLAGGASLMVLGIAWPVVVVTGVLHRIDLTPYRAASAVMRELTGNETAARAALGELARRMNAGELSDQQVNDVADRALARQANRSKSWAPWWGEFVEAARDAGRLDDARWSRYLREAVTLKLELRPQVRRGDPIPYYIMPADIRVGRPHRLAVTYRGPAPLSLSGQPIGSALHDSGQPVPASREVKIGQLMPGVIRPDPAALARLPDGTHLVVADVSATIVDTSANAPPLDHVYRLGGALFLRAADKPSVIVQRDDSLTGVVRKAMECNVQFDGTRVTVWIGQATVLPVALAMTVSVRAGDREWPIGSDVIGVGPGGLAPVSAEAPGFDATSVDVVLRSGPQVAVETVYLTEVWEGEVVLKDVPVGYTRGYHQPWAPPATPSPATRSSRPR